MLLLMAWISVAAWYWSIHRRARGGMKVSEKNARFAAQARIAAQAGVWGRRLLSWWLILVLIFWVAWTRSSARVAVLDEAWSLCVEAARTTGPGDGTKTSCVADLWRERVSAAESEASTSLGLWVVLIL